MSLLALVMFVVVVAVMLAGFPVAFTLGGTALLFALIGALAGVFDTAFLGTMPNRLFGIMGNETLVAVLEAAKQAGVSAVAIATEPD